MRPLWDDKAVGGVSCVMGCWVLEGWRGCFGCLESLGEFGEGVKGDEDWEAKVEDVEWRGEGV